MILTKLLAGLLVVALLGYQDTVSDARDIPTGTCENTAAGRHYLADSRGYVCERSGFDYTSGCCGQGQKFSCELCHEEDQCCSGYEHCVSCCLKPENNARELSKAQFRIHEQPNTGKWENEFQYCAGKCRTHKRSTLHENAFIDDRHFCFSDSGRPNTDDPPVIIPEGVKLVAGQKGATCDSTCSGVGQHCSSEATHATSSCDHLMQNFECEAGCAVATDLMEAPAYVVYGTPKTHYPTLCFLAEPAGHSSPCNSSQPHLRRLCACTDAADGFPSLMKETVDSALSGDPDALPSTELQAGSS